MVLLEGLLYGILMWYSVKVLANGIYTLEGSRFVDELDKAIV